MTSRSRTSGGAQGGRLLLAAGVFTLVNNYLPGSGHLDRLVLNTVGLVAVVLGAVCLQVPWERLHRRAPLVLAPVAFALISPSNLFGGPAAGARDDQRADRRARVPHRPPAARRPRRRVPALAGPRAVRPGPRGGGGRDVRRRLRPARRAGAIENAFKYSPLGGVGLGLYIVRQLVEAQGGTLIARNREQVGAVLGFRLPRSSAARRATSRD